MPKIPNPVPPVHRCQKPPPTPTDKNISSLLPSPCRVRISNPVTTIPIQSLYLNAASKRPPPVCPRSSPSKRPVAHGQSANQVAPPATTRQRAYYPGSPVNSKGARLQRLVLGRKCRRLKTTRKTADRRADKRPQTQADCTTNPTQLRTNAPEPDPPDTDTATRRQPTNPPIPKEAPYPAHPPHPFHHPPSRPSACVVSGFSPE